MLRTFFRAASLALVAGVATAALVACGGASSIDVPTTAGSLSSESGTLTTSDLTAADDGGGVATSPEDRPQGPPGEALAACAALSAEADCSFASPLDGSTIDGTCRVRRDDPSQYVCFPDEWDGRGGPGRGQHSPPEESLAACQGVETGAACSFETAFGSVDGTCTEGSGDSEQLACRPSWTPGEGPQEPGGGQGQGPGQGHQQAQAACEGLRAEATCSFEAPFGTVNGSCRTGRDGSTLVCAPDDWPAR